MKKKICPMCKQEYTYYHKCKTKDGVIIYSTVVEG